jgi:hypothetical protein
VVPEVFVLAVFALRVPTMSTSAHAMCNHEDVRLGPEIKVRFSTSPPAGNMPLRKMPGMGIVPTRNRHSVYDALTHGAMPVPVVRTTGYGSVPARKVVPG